MEFGIGSIHDFRPFKESGIVPAESIACIAGAYNQELARFILKAGGLHPFTLEKKLANCKPAIKSRFALNDDVPSFHVCKDFIIASKQ